MEVKIVTCPICGNQYLQTNDPQCPACSGAAKRQERMEFSMKDHNAPDTRTIALDTPETVRAERVNTKANFQMTMPPEYCASEEEKQMETMAVDEVKRRKVSNEFRETKPPYNGAFEVKTQPVDISDPAASAAEPGAETRPELNKGKEPVVGWLVAINGEHRGEDYQLRGYNTTIGRENDNTIVLTGDKCISRIHCTIRYYSDTRTYFIYSVQNASNPSYVNKKPLHEHEELHAYDVIKIGRTELLFIPLCGEHFGWSEAVPCD